MARAPWPPRFSRIPADEWVSAAPETLALKYDTVQDHGWYRNLDRTVRDVVAAAVPGAVLLDYSGGTGILAERLLAELPDVELGIVIVDASPKFLRVALDKLGGDERVAFRLIRYLKDERRLQTLQEVVGEPLLERGVDLLTSTNAIHLYYDLDDTLRSWHDLLVPGAPAFVQSGNIGVAELPEDAWIIDETVEAINDAAVELVREDDRFAAYREGLADRQRMAAYGELRRKFFLPVRPVEHYVGALGRAGFRIRDVSHVPIEARTDEWGEFLAAYHEGVLGWVGGSERIEGVPPDEAAVADRLTLLRESVARVFGGPAFAAVWTYVDAVRR